MHRNLLRNALLLASLVPATAAFGGDGDLDPAFGPNQDGRLAIDFDLGSPSLDAASDVVVFPDRSIAVVGPVAVGNKFGIGVVRLNANGALYPDWQTAVLQTGGVSIVPFAMGLQDDGSLVIGGSYLQGGDIKWIACRLGPTGAVDLDFGNDVLFGCTTHFAGGNELEGEITDLVIQPGGRIVFAGSALDANAKQRATLSSLRSDGAPDLTFADDGVGEKNIIVPFPDVAPTSKFSSIALGHNGFFAAAGTYDLTGPDSDFIVTMYKSGGLPVAGFGANGRVLDPINIGPAGARRDRAESVAIVNGKVLVAGSAQSAAQGEDSGVIVRYTSAGIVDNLFGTNGATIHSPNSTSVNLSDIAISPEGEIVVSGTSTEFGTSKQSAFLLRLTGAGLYDQTFANFGSRTFDFAAPQDEIPTSVAMAVAMQADRAIVVGQSFIVDGPDGNVDFGVVRIGDGVIFSDGFDPSGG